jgi:hypothetical protein
MIKINLKVILGHYHATYNLCLVLSDTNVKEDLRGLKNSFDFCMKPKPKEKLLHFSYAPFI